MNVSGEKSKVQFSILGSCVFQVTRTRAISSKGGISDYVSEGAYGVSLKFFSFFLHCTLSPFLPAFQLESGSILFVPVESLVVLEELPECLKEEPELWELDEVVPVRIVRLGHRLHVVEAAVDGGDRVKQLVHRDHVTDALGVKSLSMTMSVSIVHLT